MSRSLVLGYGLLLDEAHVRDLCGDAHVLSLGTGVLRGFRRQWNLVYRNDCWDEGRYVDAVTGETFAGGVAFLGVEKSPGTEMPVREIEVTAAGLAALDEAEFMYRRVDVAAAYGGPAPVWLYQDVPEEYPEAAYVGDRVVVTREYFECVRTAAAGLTPDGEAAFDRTTAPCPWPIADLEWQETGH